MPIKARNRSGQEATTQRAFGFAAMGVFLFFGATMAALAGITLALPGTPLDQIWRLNPEAYLQMAPMGRGVGVMFLLLSAIMAVAATGWFQRKLWGYWLAVIIIFTQVAGDLVNFIRGDYLRGGVGFAIAGVLLAYLLQSRVRSAFISNHGDSLLSRE
jgi:hypothetical protein